MNGFSPNEIVSCQEIIRLAIAEDLSSFGDRTSLALIPAEQRGSAAFVARQPGVLAGLPAIELVAKAISSQLVITMIATDGNPVRPGETLATILGPLQALLAAERICLNFLQHLSGIATLTNRYVKEIGDSSAAILDTRKTIPGWRLLEKYAVRMGGGTNHRLGLYDGILIKDNHLAGLNGNIQTAIARARSWPGNEKLAVEIEVDSLEQLEDALIARADIVLLDNMTPLQLQEAVCRRNELAPATKLEASGGVNLGTVQAIAATGVDRISIGALTHSATALDIGLDYLNN